MHLQPALLERLGAKHIRSLPQHKCMGQVRDCLRFNPVLLQGVSHLLTVRFQRVDPQANRSGIVEGGQHRLRLVAVLLRKFQV